MAHEEEVPTIRPPESVVITVLRCKNLKGSKGDSLNSLVRVEFGASLLGESSKVEANIETHTTEYNFSASFDCSFEDTSCLDAISYKPVTATVIEVLPKDRKGKEEKTNVLGQSCIDLIPLLRGETKFSVVQGVHPLTPPTEATIVEHVLPEIEVHVSVSQSLLTETQLNSSNLLSVHVNSVYSVPEAWQVQMAQQFNYTVSLPVPLSKGKENTIVLSNGTLRAPGEKEASNQRKWSSAPSASGSCLYIADRYALPSGKKSVKYRLHYMHYMHYINHKVDALHPLGDRILKRLFFFSLQNKIAQNRYWPVEIVRTPIQQATKAKGKQAAVEEDVLISYHGVAYVNMAPLLYPGVRRIRGAYMVKPFMESEVYEKTKRKGTLAEEAVRVVSGMNRALASAMAQKAPPPSKQGKADAKTKPPAPVLKPGDATAAEGESNEVKNLEGQQYLESRTFITLEFVLDNPLVPKRPPSSLARKVAEYIPPRPVFARKPGGSKKAVEDFHTQLTTVANSLLEEFRQMYGDDLMKGNLPLSSDAMDQRRQKFLYELNTSGKYFAFKEQLKNSVIKIVREKYLNTTAFVDKEKLQAFLSELYVFLIDQMHAALVNQNFELAAKYYQERLSRSKNDPDHWFDYGTFCLLIGDYGKAEECFKETLSIAQKHVPGLLMYGCMALMNERYEEAETFFEAATCTESKSVIAWTMLGLYFDSIQNDIGAERAFLEANRFNVATPPSVALEEKAAVARELEGFVSESGAEDPSGEGAHGTGTTEAPRLPEVYGRPPKEKQALVKANTSIFLQTANFLLEVNALQLTDAALAHELVASNGSPGGDYYVLLGRLKIQQKNFIEAEENLKQAIAVKHENPDAWGLMGHLNYLTSKTEEARECYERTLDYTTEASDMHAIYLRLASIYLEQGEFEKAKATFLKACIRSPSCVSWLGVGVACYRLGDLAEAEDALSEANILNNKDAEVWSYLSLICLQV
ncbi:PREDICTED: cilia- and flagella-associated protein 70-like [Acropora digitifera]|uniref:cilia- and flagella-associated protein 70-like n=1 Tax=Acropora digitifera TaxID=70779 RepID=UPI00077A0737|nr:PREDICTED: cilia- and flagella-associated protein 70-like [Acropora digitifera]